MFADIWKEASVSSIIHFYVPAEECRRFLWNVLTLLENTWSNPKKGQFWFPEILYDVRDVAENFCATILNIVRSETRTSERSAEKSLYDTLDLFNRTWLIYLSSTAWVCLLRRLILLTCLDWLQRQTNSVKLEGRTMYYCNIRY
jgi:hypothetical protein